MDWRYDLIFVSAQPDVPYFHWQCEVYLNNFIKMGIPPRNIHVIFAITAEDGKLSDGALELKKYTPNIHGFEDNRERKHYIPSIKPYLIYKWLEEFPKLGRLFFLHDSDIIFNSLPDFEKIIYDKVNYFSDAGGYMNFQYIMDCATRYEEKHPSLDRGQLLREMCDIVGVEPGLVKKKNDSSGGAQYIFKYQEWFHWYKIYKDSIAIYDKLLRFHAKYPIDSGEIQFWTSEMWAILWNLWWWNQPTNVSDELSFCWATDHIVYCEQNKILHMAGVTEDSKNNRFYKGDFIDSNPIQLLKETPNYFDYVDTTSSTYKYVQEIKKLSQK